MDIYEKKKIIRDYVKEICHYGQMQVFATSYYQSAFFQREMDEVTDRLISFCLEQPSVPQDGQNAQPAPPYHNSAPKGGN